MSAQRFVAANATDALRRIKAELGGDAVVLSSNDVADGVEIIAIAAADLADLPPPTASTSSPVRPAPMGAAPLPAPEHLGPPHGPATRRAVQTPSTPLRQSFEARVSQQAAQRPSLRDPVPSASITMPLTSRGLPTAPMPMPMAPASTEPVRAATAPDPGLNVLSSQMVELKSLLSGHVAAGFWSSLQQTSPGHALLTRRLLNAGLSSQIVSQMLADLPVESDFDRLLDHAQQWVKQRLQVQDAFSMFDQGGVFAFIGPTGVGKTTTLAKIAARCVLRYGRRQVAVMTTDTYRIGAQEQLRVFARILNLPVVSLRDSDDMESKVADLSTRKIVLLDTAGVSQRDSMMVEQLELIRQGCSAVHRVLVMSATTSTRTLDDVIASHHQAIGGRGFDSSILTKIDEGMSLAPAIDCVLRHRLPMLFLSNGQRVPEDLFAADAAYIAHRTVNPRGGDETGVDPAHVPAMIADDINAWMAEARSP